MARKRPEPDGSSGLLARLARRDRWPRRWWSPPAAEAPVPLDADTCRKRHRDITDILRNAMFGLVGFSLFCMLTLGTSDSQLLTGASKIPVPFANTQIDFIAFVTIGPLFLIAYTFYLHIFLGQLRALPPLPEPERSAALFNLSGGVPALLSGLVFYWLAPATVLMFAYKAAPRPVGTWLTLVAALFAAVLLLLQLRQRTFASRRRMRLLLWLLMLVALLVPVRIVWWELSGGERPFQRAWRLDGADLAKANLTGADLENADLEKADMRGADLTRAKLRRAKLANADLSDAVLRNADLRDADLDGAKLGGARFDNANLRYASVREANLVDAVLSAEQVRGLCFDGATLFPPGLRPVRMATQCIGGGRTRRDRPLVCETAASLPRARCDLSLIRAVVEPANGYVPACLRPCDPYYVDRGRSHTLAGVPPALADAVWIKTTNTGDKSETAEDFLRFEIEPPAWVYVGYDSRMTGASYAPPDWLTRNFQRTDLMVQLNEPDARQDFVLYRRLFATSTVVLGGNRAAGAKFGSREGSNYVVLVKRAGDRAPAAEPTAQSPP